ncbi:MULTISPECIES: glycerophosphodiester phosphodiesterase [Staphylococcus]|uniref:glycerophosphodiester phosphodiesterase n=1 Tax=Staphylococcus pasteuri TaxID=45972 RepID=UPI000D333A28|nr:glycerophosphodiester phosphodiesterase [Staphylococcus pasteuri]VXC57447.1 Glycerophosphodiester phosphodiesterase [Staphylococcus sp. 8AQ]MBM6506888.1 glycerophosphodiester phosphodiesterase [Staphylococcus pasteuri]MCD9065869.1 glycerophosphodiester phosphodiesterase [Staphylococcus pasteuri]PTU83841.1 glycerophosphodiester phosphodiesterase [Staphylococcus pasteuri]PTU86535.1 glycerophosphodiester phosphodiesterase [Staphylococcus pasteuri]
MKINKWVFASVATVSLLGMANPVYASGNGQTNNGQYDQQSTQSSSNQNQSTNWQKNLTGEAHTTIAHRGASGYAPEHTFNSYDKSHRELGASYIEIDLQRTKDGHLVAMHDETVDRTTNGHGRVEDYTLDELKKLDAGSWFNKQHPNLAKSEYKNAKVPTLDEILSRYGKNANYYIETKSPDVYPGMENQLIQSLNKHGMLTNQSLKNGHVIVQSFSEPSLQKMKQLSPNIPLIRLLDKGELTSQTESDLKRIKSYAIGVGPEYTDLNENNTKHLKDLGFLIHPFTVNNETDMQRLNDYGVDGVFTNYADKYKNISHE